MIVATEETVVVGGKTKKIRTKIAPATNSTNGYCQEILLLQPLQVPFWAKKLRIGNSSIHDNFLPQDIHLDRPPMVTPVLNLIETTLRKLPTIVPNMKATIEENRSTDIYEKVIIGGRFFTLSQRSIPKNQKRHCRKKFPT